ncbi:four helix bundle protein [Marivirga sp. S37H4]|uniref:Four helix bundle protein n=1 Tax=Marivirga aurantiaca TaxID=2802615 RepID=A0A934X1H5_9BACT|nr:four helix bundle protein [Marivirga aurantiaca]MBK6266751.1 four helix bundle protein [Marivirga aurantiaca]
MQDYRKLRIWLLAKELTKNIYELTKTFPTEEKYGLTSQMRRCAVSVPSNIAEGAGRNGNKEFNNFLGITMGSLFELDMQVELSYNFRFMQVENYNEILEKITQLKKMIFLFQKKLNT